MFLRQIFAKNAKNDPKHFLKRDVIVAELWYPGLQNFNTMCKIVGMKGTASLVAIPALV